MKIISDIGIQIPQVYLPKPGVDPQKWAVIACDQFTSEPEYWNDVEKLVGDAPSTLRLTFPEVYLEGPGGDERIQNIQAAMKKYMDEGILQPHDGFVYVERQTLHGKTRKGLMLCLDLERYDYNKGSSSLIRATEGTIVDRLPPRIKIREGAMLEFPHILVLIDDPNKAVIEPLTEAKAKFQKLYDFETMLGSGHLAGYAVDATFENKVIEALRGLASPETFAAKYGVDKSLPVLLFAMGDGNHSLATAKAIWDDLAAAGAPADHPCRHALVEIENIHDPALEFEPIHRLLFGVRIDLRAKLAEALGPRLRLTELPSAAALAERVRLAPGQAAGLVGPGDAFTLLEIADPPSTLAVGSLQPLLDRWLDEQGFDEIDYVHGDDTLARLAREPGCAGVHLPALDKSALLRMVVREGVLPRKTFSMGEAHEKRYYVEARRLDPA